jgi:DNA-directed RNA polymerase beta' subunit
MILRDNKKYASKVVTNTRGFEIEQDDIVIRNGKKIKVWLYEHSKCKKLKLEKGDVVIRENEIFRDVIPPEPKNFELKIGDTIERSLQNGDLVVLNRQPTLWKGSMRAKKVVIRPGKTFRFALCSTAAFNADQKY